MNGQLLGKFRVMTAAPRRRRNPLAKIVMLGIKAIGPRIGIGALMCLYPFIVAAEPLTSDPSELRFWLDNMIRHHGYSVDETAEGLGLPSDEVARLIDRWNVKTIVPGGDRNRSKVKVMPWAPGRHPRLGFLDGAIDPQRDTKVSIFLPWDGAGYVVFDLPEAVFSNLGLAYLAHTHVPTLWTQRGVTLETLDWRRNPDRTLETERTLPNKISFGARVVPLNDGVSYTYWLRNGTEHKLSGLRNQLCLMLKNAPDFNAQAGENKVLLDGATAAASADGRRWIVTACERAKSWENPPVPCIHADPVFPDCAPGERVEVKGRVFFFEGADVRAEIERRRKSGTLFQPG